MKFIAKHSDIIVLTILWTYGIRAIYFDIFSNYIIPVSTYYGFGGLIVLTILRTLRRKYFKVFLAVFLLLGCFGLIRFGIWTRSVFMEFGNGTRWEMPIGYLSILLLCFLVAVNLNSISIIHKDPELAPDKVDIQSENYFNKYYAELKEKDDSYLLNIITTKERWQKEYIQAAEKLLEERKLHF